MEKIHHEITEKQSEEAKRLIAELEDKNDFNLEDFLNKKRKLYF